MKELMNPKAQDISSSWPRCRSSGSSNNLVELCKSYILP